MIYLLIGVVLCMATSAGFSLCGLITKDDDVFDIARNISVVAYTLVLVLDIIGFVSILIS